MTHNTDWAAIVGQFQDPFASAEEFVDFDAKGRLDDHGEYTALVKAVRKGTLKDNVTPYWAVMGTFLDGVDKEGKPLKDEDFQIGFFSMKAAGVLKGFVRGLTGETVSDIMVADEALDNAVGKVLRLELRIKGEFANFYILEVVPT